MDDKTLLSDKSCTLFKKVLILGASSALKMCQSAPGVSSSSVNLLQVCSSLQCSLTASTASEETKHGILNECSKIRRRFPDVCDTRTASTQQ